MMSTVLANRCLSLSVYGRSESTHQQLCLKRAFFKEKSSKRRAQDIDSLARLPPRSSLTPSKTWFPQPILVRVVRLHPAFSSF